MVKCKMYVCLLINLIFFKASILGQSPLELATKYHQLAQQKASNFKEVDSIYYYASNAKKLFDDLGHDSMLFESNSQLIYWNIQMLEYQEAQTLIKENLYVASLHPTWLMRTYFDFANFYGRNHKSNIDSSIHYSKLAYKMATEQKDTLHALVGLECLVDNYLLMTDSMHLIPQLYEEGLLLKDYDEQTQSMFKLFQVDMGNYYLSIDHPLKAISFLETQSHLEKNNDDVGFTKWVLDLLADAYAQSGQYEEAYQTSQESAFLASRLADQNKLDAIQKAKFQFDTERKEETIAQLKKANDLKEKTARRQRILLWLLFLGSIIVICLSWFLYRMMKNRRKSDQQLIDLQQRITEQQTRLFTNITHEFRTPLTVILGMVEHLKENRNTVLIRRNAKKLLQLVNQLMSLAKSDAGLLKLKMVNANIINYIDYLVESHLLLARKKNIRLLFHSDLGEFHMDHDREKLSLIITNLISNAIKYTPSGGKIIVLAENKEDALLLRIKDTGVGIAESDLTHIFDRFYQSNQESSGGTGIGLALVKELVEIMTGSIHVESQLTKGTTFSVFLPITQKAEVMKFVDHIGPVVEESNEEEQLDTSDLTQDNPLILIVEDNEDVLTYIKTCFHESSYEIISENNGVQGCRTAIQRIPDLVISDIMMPEMDGYELCERLKKDIKTEHIPIILLTAKATQAEKLKGLQHGADVYLSKPFDVEELLLRVSSQIEIREKLKRKYSTGATSFDESNPFMKKLYKTLQNHYGDEQFGVEELANAMHFSRMQLHRKLKSITGQTSSEVLREFRLAKAHDIVELSDQTIAEIAYMVGFSSPSYFSQMYKKKYGLSPKRVTK